MDFADILDLLIPVLFIAMPFIFKMIGKRLEAAGKDDAAATMKKIVETISDGDDDIVEDADDADEPDLTTFAPELPVADVKPVVPVAIAPKQVKKAKHPILKEEKENKKKEIIDPKKLVIYSEIMKPKF